MEYKDWEELDKLLGLEGFGGYYDLVECLKDIANGWFSDVEIEFPFSEEVKFKISKIKTIKEAVNFLQAFHLLRHNIRSKKMPYIPDKAIRKALDGYSECLINVLREEGITGNLNYFIFRTIKHLCKKYKDYAHFEGDLHKALRESFRRFEVPYEDKKIKENGDVE